MKDLLSKLVAITFYSKTVHYNCSGANAYSDHLLADKIIDDLDSFRDDINEVCFLGEEEPAPLSKEVLSGAMEIIPDESGDINSMFKSLDMLIVNTIDYIQSLMCEGNDLSEGEKNLLGGIAQDLQFKHGLLYLRLK